MLCLSDEGVDALNSRSPSHCDSSSMPDEQRLATPSQVIRLATPARSSCPAMAKQFNSLLESKLNSTKQEANSAMLLLPICHSWFIDK